MNVESLKSELQQVLDNDLMLRKEFNNLKRSLSDYRNQLIMRDEDCKRLQVTIDVLNTKLVVMERDNNNYKAELTSFKELKGTIKEQLQAKQEEIDARLEEIQSLRNDLNTVAAGYESQIAEIKASASAELESAKIDFSTQLNDLRSNTHYKEAGIKEEYENRLNELSNGWAEKEQNMLLAHQHQLESTNNLHREEVEKLRAELEQKIQSAGNSNAEELNELRAEHERVLSDLENTHALKLSSMDEAYRLEISNLKQQLEEKSQLLQSQAGDLNAKLQSELLNKEESLTSLFNDQLNTLKSGYEMQYQELVASYESRIGTMVSEYEEKISNTLIHSNSQNSKLNEELCRLQDEQARNLARLDELSSGADQNSSELESVNVQLKSREEELSLQLQRTAELELEIENLKQQIASSESEQVNVLNQQIASLNLSHSDYVSELQSQIENLNTELKNLGQLFENNTNALAEAEVSIELKSAELATALQQVDEANARLESFNSSFEDKEVEFENYKNELQETLSAELKAKQLEFDKLLAENTNLIEEIDSAQDKVEAQENELAILKAELEEIRVQSVGKSQYFKETLSNRNFEITNLEASNAALSQEIVQLKEEVGALNSQLKETAEASLSGAQVQEELEGYKSRCVALESQITELTTVKTTLEAQLAAANAINEQLMDEIQGLKSDITDLNKRLEDLNNLNADLQTQVAQLMEQGETAKQEEFINRLFKQIDELNDQRLALLDEKEQMAGQLLKMNEVIGSISQQVDSESIDVTSLNNHRKNVILANNSGSVEKSPMKKQINDLVREIDKCIALLSA